MGGIALENESLATDVARILADHKALDVILLDVRETAGWADYFVIGTCTSSAHMKGLLRHLEEYLASSHLVPLNKPDPADDQRWLLLDLGTVVVHVMTAEARQFYDLESLWFKASRVSIGASAPSSGETI